MNEEKPLNVLVAEALTGRSAVLWHFSEKLQRAAIGPNPTGKTSGSWALPVCVRDPGFIVEGHDGRLFDAPLYDQDWAAAGPLIERYQVWLATNSGLWFAEVRWPQLFECSERRHPTPLLAVCDLILTLHSQGKLTEPAA